MPLKFKRIFNRISEMLRDTHAGSYRTSPSILRFFNRDLRLKDMKHADPPEREGKRVFVMNHDDIVIISMKFF